MTLLLLSQMAVYSTVPRDCRVNHWGKSDINAKQIFMRASVGTRSDARPVLDKTSSMWGKHFSHVLEHISITLLCSS